MGRAAVFLDRDGTLIEDRGAIRDPSQVAFYPETIDALRRLGGQFPLFIVTNQSWIAQGVLRVEEAATVNAFIVRRLAEEGIEIREVYTCPHAREDGCECHKPRPLFLRRAARDHGVDLSRSFVVGDHPADVELAAATGAHGIYLLTGHGEKHRAELSVLCDVRPGIAAAVDTIAARHGARVLRKGGLAAFPTETVYGLGADASNPAAARRVFAVKGRPATHPLIVHLADAAALPEWAAEVPGTARLLADRFWPGPLTLILRKSPRVPDEVTGGQDTVGLRVPSHPLALELIRTFGGGVAAPSANRFGRVSPTTAAHVREDLGADADFVLDGGPCAVGVESTIVDCSSAAPLILRPGGVPREAIEALLGRPVPVAAQSDVRAPGQLESHYAPRAEVIVVRPDELQERAAQLERRGLKVAVLETPDAANLYSRLREADREGAGAILVTLPPEEGLGLAIVDRLRKAAGPRLTSTGP